MAPQSIHAPGPFAYTLCGDVPARPTANPREREARDGEAITCRRCIRIIEHVRRHLGARSYTWMLP